MKLLLTSLFASGALLLTASAHCGSCAPEKKEKKEASCGCSEKCDKEKKKEKKKDSCGCSEKCETEEKKAA